MLDHQIIPNVKSSEDAKAKPVENIRGLWSQKADKKKKKKWLAAVRSDGEGRMKNMNEEGEQRKGVQVTRDVRFI